MPGTTQTARTQKSPIGLPQQSQLPIVPIQCFAPEVELGLRPLREVRVALVGAEMVDADTVVTTVDGVADGLRVWVLNTALVADVEQPRRMDGTRVIQRQERQFPIFGHCQYSFRR
jgi:hypothetical protein